MATINEKILAMLATIKEMRQNLAKGSLFGVIAKHSPIAQKDLFELLPYMSVRTVRRRLDELIRQKKIRSHREGRTVVYSVYPH